MKLYVLADMEGISGIRAIEQVKRDSNEYAHGRELMMREKALAAGFCDFALKPIVAHELAQRIRKALDRR